MNKRKTILLAALIMVNIMLFASTAWAAPVKIVVDGRLLDLEVAPVIENGRTLVQIGAVSLALSAQVGWDAGSRTVTITKDCDQLLLTVGSYTAYKNGAAFELETPARIINSRTMVPLSYVSMALGADVQWDGMGRTVYITSPAYNPPSS